MTKVLIFGTFDKLHPGHLFVFEQAKQRGEVTVVVARDANVSHIKGHEPSQGETERVASVQAAFPEAMVQLGDGSDYLEPVRSLSPDLILLGYDQRLPPGIEEADLPCAVERLEPYRPNEFKSSLM